MYDSVVYLIEGGFALGILGFMWKISSENNRKVDTIFKRFDEYKEFVKKDFVNKDICVLKHENLMRDVSEIKTDVKILIKNGNYDKGYRNSEDHGVNK
jgi:hypothetical protein